MAKAAIEGSKHIKRGEFEKALAGLRVELVHMLDWIRNSGHKLVVVFEGRDAAGKGGTIKRIVDPLNPRYCRVVALPAPTERERTSGTSSATSHTCPRRARWSSSTGPGTTGRASSG